MLAFSPNRDSSSSFDGSFRSYLAYARVGMPKICRCGSTVTIRTSQDGKKFFFCRGFTNEGAPHLQVLFDEAIVEELHEINDRLADIDTQLTYIAMDCGRLDKLVADIEVLKESGRKREVKSAWEFRIAGTFGVVVTLMALLILFLK